MRCTSYCTSEAYDLKKLSVFFKERSVRMKLHNKEVLHVSGYLKGRELFFFDYGCVVFWDYSADAEQAIIKSLAEFSVPSFAKFSFEAFSVTLRRPGSKTLIENDNIILGGNRILDKLTLSFAISQSVKLSYFEDVLEKTGQESKKIPHELAARGKISLSRKQIAKKLGKLFLVRNSINLHTEMLDTPDFFWEHPQHENLYKLITKNLDVPQRVEVLNRRLDMVRDLFAMLEEQMNHQHSSFLEWIIIILISTEIILFLAKESKLLSFF